MDGEWHVPHFEKMLYDQAQIIQAYADAYVITKDTFYSDIVDDIAMYVARDLRHKVLLLVLSLIPPVLCRVCCKSYFQETAFCKKDLQLMW